MRGTEKAQRSAGLLEITRVLVLVQAGIMTLSTLELLVMGAVTGGAGLAPSLLLTVSGVILALVLSWALGRRYRWSRYVTVGAEAVILVGAGVDLTVSMLMTFPYFGLLSLLTRIVLPIAVIALVRRAPVRGLFVSSAQAEVSP